MWTDRVVGVLNVLLQVIARRLLQSKQTIPHYYLCVDVEMDAVLQSVASAVFWFCYSQLFSA